MTDPLYKSGTSLEKTGKEERRDWLIDELQLDLSDEAIIDIGRLKLTTINEIREKLKERNSDADKTEIQRREEETAKGKQPAAKHKDDFTSRISYYN